MLNVDVPRAFYPLLQPMRYKGAYGGRGGAKSHFFAEQLIIACYTKPTRCVCIREVQLTIRDSVRQLLVDKIAKLKLESYFDVLDNEIRGIRGSAKGSLIVFRGMQNYNADNIKSLENFDIAWVEEAQTLSARSLKLLRPTIRKPGSELWFSWNPRHDTDAVDQFFRGGDVRSNSIAVPVGWQDNPWFGEPLLSDMREDYTANEEEAEHVWGGGYELVTEGNYYAKNIRQAEREGRVGYYPFRPSLPVITSWDIGVDDYTAVWFWQEDGVSATAIDYYEVSGDGAQQVVETALAELVPDDAKSLAALKAFGRERPFTYSKHYLPHDVMNREWGAGAKSRYQTLQGLGVKPVKVGARQGPEERINAMRDIFPILRFHDCANVQLGLKRLRRYSRKKNEQMEIYTGVLHDENSHGADAAGEFAVNCSIRPVKEDARPKLREPSFVGVGQGTIQATLSVKDAVAIMTKKRNRR